MQYCHQISHEFGAFFCKQSRLILKFTRMRHKNYQGTLRSKSGYEDVAFQTKNKNSSNLCSTLITMNFIDNRKQDNKYPVLTNSVSFSI